MPGPFEPLPGQDLEPDCSGCQGHGTATQTKAAKAASENAPLRVVFMGTPDFAADILAELLTAPFISVAGVYCQPDRPAGRGKKLAIPPVKALALEKQLPIFQPLNFKPGPQGDAAAAELAALAPDVLVVAAYGLILPQRVLDIPAYMPVNVHASLLPTYRGAAPIQRAIMAGDAVTGVTIMRMEAGLDTGPILMQRAVGIDLNDSAVDLHRELAREGAALLLLALQRLSAGTLHAIAQDENKATYAPKLAKEESRLDFSLSARALHARIRGLMNWPGANATLLRAEKDTMVVALEPGRFPLTAPMQAKVAEYAAQHTDKPESGLIMGLVDGALLVACGDGAYALTRLRPAGGKSMDAAAFANGYLAGATQARFT